MKIHRKYLLEQVASKPNTSRKPLESIYVFLDKEQYWATATNAKCLAIVPVELNEKERIELEENNSIKAIGLKYQRSNPEYKRLSEIDVALEKLNGEYPDFKNVLRKENPKITIGIDVSLLQTLALALGCKRLILDIVAPDKPIMVSSYEDEAHGVIMPLNLANSK